MESEDRATPEKLAELEELIRELDLAMIDMPWKLIDVWHEARAAMQDLIERQRA